MRSPSSLLMLYLFLKNISGMSFQRRLLRQRLLHSKILTKESPNIDDGHTIRATKTWVTLFVHGQGMCPFAGSVLADKSLLVKVVKSNENNSIMRMTDLFNKIILDARLLIDSNSFKTSLLVIPQMIDFSEYLTLVHNIEEYIVDHGIDKYIQVATFHPDYQFEGTSFDDVSNWTNRSPYPLIHLLREADVSDALEKYPYDPDDIWKKNIEKLNSLGRENIEKMMRKIQKQANSDLPQVTNE